MKVTEGGQRILPEAGVHAARLIRIIDMGTQHNETYGTDARKVRFSFELVDLKHTFSEEAGPQPFLIDRQYTLSLNSKATMRKDMEGWLGRSLTDAELADGFELSDLLDTAGQLQVTHTEDGKYANVGTLMAAPKGVKTSKAANSIFLFDLDDMDSEIFESFPQWMQDVIANAPEFTVEKSELKADSIDDVI